MKRYLAALLCILMAVAGEQGCNAEASVADSVEWATVDAQLVVLGRVTGIADAPQAGNSDAAIAVQRVLKGEAPAGSLSVRVPLSPAEARKASWNPDSGEAVYFLTRESGSSDAARWRPRPSRLGVIELKGLARAYLENRTAAKSEAEVLQAIKSARETTSPKPILLPVDPADPLFAELFSGGACYLRVPADSAVRALALKQITAPNPFERVRGVELLANYGGAATQRILSGLLADKGTARWMSDGDRLAYLTYPVRAAAYNALRTLGAAPAQPVVRRAPLPAEIADARSSYWKEMLRGILPKGWSIASFRAVTAPEGWKRTAGGPGYAVTGTDATYMVMDGPGKVHFPRVSLTLLPLNWEGRAVGKPARSLEEGRLHALNTSDAGTVDLCDRYLGHIRRYHIFVTSHGYGKWQNAEESVNRLLAPTLDRVEIKTNRD